MKEKRRMGREGLLYRKKRRRIGIGKNQRGEASYQKSPKEEKRK